MLTKAKLSELFDSVDRTRRALSEENSPLREFLSRDELWDVCRFLEQAEMRFPTFGTAAPTSMNLPDLLAMPRSFES
jgi:hypothetical protein